MVYCAWQPVYCGSWFIVAAAWFIVAAGLFIVTGWPLGIGRQDENSGYHK